MSLVCDGVNLQPQLPPRQSVDAQLCETLHAVNVAARKRGVTKREARREMQTFLAVRSRAPKEEQPFHAGLKAMMATTNWPRSYPKLVRLWPAVAVLPISTMECERDFSGQNIIKSWQRTGLHDAKLGDLMTLSLLEYDVEWSDIVEVWPNMKKRRPTKRKGNPVDASKKRGGVDGSKGKVHLQQEKADHGGHKLDAGAGFSDSSSDDEEDGHEVSFSTFYLMCAYYEVQKKHGSSYQDLIKCYPD